MCSIGGNDWITGKVGLRWFSCDLWTKGQHLEMRHCAWEVSSNSVGRDQCPSFVTLVGSGEKLTIKDQQGLLPAPQP